MGWENRADPSYLSTDEGPLPFWCAWPRGFSENFTRGKGETTKLRLAVDWFDAAAFKQAALGYSEKLESTVLVGGSGSGSGGAEYYLSRKIPLILPWTEGEIGRAHV